MCIRAHADASSPSACRHRLNCKKGTEQDGSSFPHSLLILPRKHSPTQPPLSGCHFPLQPKVTSCVPGSSSTLRYVGLCLLPVHPVKNSHGLAVSHVGTALPHTHLQARLLSAPRRGRSQEGCCHRTTEGSGHKDHLKEYKSKAAAFHLLAPVWKLIVEKVTGTTTGRFRNPFLRVAEVALPCSLGEGKVLRGWL